MHRSAVAPVRRLAAPRRPGLRVRLLSATGVAGVAGFALAACGGGDEPARCVEQATGRLVAEAQCPRPGSGSSVAQSDEFGGAADSVARRPQQAGGIGMPGIFAWYYGGRLVNGLVRGGGWQPQAGIRYRTPGGARFGAAGAGRGRLGGSAVRSGGTSRGGFGATGARGSFGG